MMDDKEKLLKEAANPLTYLFRKVLLELGVEAKPWNRRLTAFLSSPLSRNVITSTERLPRKKSRSRPFRRLCRFWAPSAIL